jgi:hypothetical protein
VPWVRGLQFVYKLQNRGSVYLLCLLYSYKSTNTDLPAPYSGQAE